MDTQRNLQPSGGGEQYNLDPSAIERKARLEAYTYATPISFESSQRSLSRAAVGESMAAETQQASYSPEQIAMFVELSERVGKLLEPYRQKVIADRLDIEEIKLTLNKSDFTLAA